MHEYIYIYIYIYTYTHTYIYIYAYPAPRGLFLLLVVAFFIVVWFCLFYVFILVVFLSQGLFYRRLKQGHSSRAEDAWEELPEQPIEGGGKPSLLPECRAGGCRSCTKPRYRTRLKGGTVSASATSAVL